MTWQTHSLRSGDKAQFSAGSQPGSCQPKTQAQRESDRLAQAVLVSRDGFARRAAGFSAELRALIAKP
jgi:hypothetical protein